MLIEGIFKRKNWLSEQGVPKDGRRKMKIE